MTLGKVYDPILQLIKGSSDSLNLGGQESKQSPGQVLHVSKRDNRQNVACPTSVSCPVTGRQEWREIRPVPQNLTFEEADTVRSYGPSQPLTDHPIPQQNGSRG